MKRHLNTVVISDTHLGTYGCHAKELLNYLRSIKTETLVLNGDFIDIWQFSKRYFPDSHMKIIHEIMKMALSGTKVYYITGNHDDVLRKFSEFSAGNFHLRDKLVLNIKGKNYWIFHGDIFDVSIKHTKWLAKLGAKGYGWLILLNRLVNKFRKGLGKSRMSFAGKIKAGFKKAIKQVNDFEEIAISLAIQNNFDCVICGHIHQPIIKTITRENRSVLYMNSGDWTENLTALEYRNNKWELYKYDEVEYEYISPLIKIKDKNSPKTTSKNQATFYPKIIPPSTEHTV
ncbi:MAG: UDP-2,3-diacylglucosamine diphosphatase [Bacteroidota bacterium]